MLLLNVVRVSRSSVSYSGWWIVFLVMSRFIVNSSELLGSRKKNRLYLMNMMVIVFGSV